MEVPNLPPETISEILSRLPVKSLLRFRCVSKPWCSLISDPQFVKSHLSQSIALKQERVFISADPLQSIDCNLLSMNHDDDANAITELDYPWRTPDTTVVLLGPCNGLICLLTDSARIIVFNPSTRYFRELPPHPEIEGSDEFFHGFGFDSSVLNYKVVRAPRFPSACGDIEFVVFGSKENSWRNQRLGHCSGVSEGVGTFLNGVVHWLGFRGSGSDQVNVIICFDLSEEVLTEMPQPSHGDKAVEFHVLGVLQGCLCVLCYNDDISIDVWTMKDYGVRESWTEFVVVPCDMGAQYMDYVVPLCFLKNGEVVLNINGRDVVIYNVEEKTFTSLLIRGDPNWFETGLYLESLLSPYGVAGDDEH